MISGLASTKQRFASPPDPEAGGSIPAVRDVQSRPASGTQPIRFCLCTPLGKCFHYFPARVSLKFR